MELVVQKATELGVAEIRPVITLRTTTPPPGLLEGSRQERWEKVASGAAEHAAARWCPGRAHDYVARAAGPAVRGA